MYSRLNPNWISKVGAIVLIGGVLIFSALQFLSGGEATIQKTEHGTITYRQVPYFDGEQKKVRLNSKELNIEGQSITTLIKYLEMIGKIPSIDHVTVTKRVTTYNLKYTTKHDTIYYQDFLDALQSEGLIIKKDNPK